MELLKLIYFEGCPNIKAAKEALMKAGVSYEEIRQDDLSKNDPLRNFSSPTIIKGNTVLFGTPTGADGGCSIGAITAQEILRRLAK